MGEKQLYASVSDFLHDDSFILWYFSRTDESNTYWVNFIQENPQLQPYFQEAIKKLEAIRFNIGHLPEGIEDKLYLNITERINTHQKAKKKHHSIYWFSIASSLLLLVASATLFMLTRTSQQAPSIAAPSEISSETDPSGSVQLISGGKIINLNQNTVIELSAVGEASIVDSTKIKKTVDLDQNDMNKLIVPFGKRSFIALADGSKVWLNSGTELEFPTRFAQNTRNIKVKGEIYIEVAKSEHPFFIQTLQSTVQVLGTKFNVAAYEDEETESVVLVEGSVQINTRQNKSLLLLPNEMAQITGNNLEKRTVDVSSYISWRNGVLEFDERPMSEILKTLGRYYNVFFETDPNLLLNRKIYSGKLFLSNNLDSVMTSVSALSSTEYKRENNKIYIFKK